MLPERTFCRDGGSWECPGLLVWSVAVLPDGSRALSGSKDATLKLWDIASAQVIASLPAEAPVRSVAVAHKSPLAVSTGKNALQSWNLTDASKIQPFEGHEGMVNCVASRVRLKTKTNVSPSLVRVKASRS